MEKLNPAVKPKIITRPILILSVVSLLTDIASEMLYPIMPIYLRSIGFSVVLIGILEGLVEAVAGISKGYFGNLSDSIQKRAIFVRIGYTMSAIAKPLIALFTNPVWVFCVRTVERLGKGVRTSARDALLSDYTTPENKGRVFGFHRSMDTVGAAIGPIIALIFLYFSPGQYVKLFAISVIPGIFAILLSFLVKDKKQDIQPVRQKVGFFTFLSYWKEATPQYKLIVSGLLFFTLINSADTFLLLFLKFKGLSDTQIIGTYIFYNIIYAALSYPVGILSDKIGQKKIVIAGLFAFAVVYGAYSFVNAWWVFFVLFFIYGFYASATEGISKALITNIVDKSKTATALGFYNSFASIATLFASSLAGFIWNTFSPRATFLISSIGSFCVAVFFLLTIFKPQYSMQKAL
ncbi:MAG: MFS transporter [Candidatus Kapabacteria bacterium]|nr:MFS transporter [Candidatus Kapabacteria bacterium]